MKLVLLVIYGAGCFGLGWHYCFRRLEKKGRELFREVDKYADDDDNPPGSL